MKQEAKLFPSEILQACACVFARHAETRFRLISAATFSRGGKKTVILLYRSRATIERKQLKREFSQSFQKKLWENTSKGGEVGRGEEKATDGRTENKNLHS